MRALPSRMTGVSVGVTGVEPGAGVRTGVTGVEPGAGVRTGVRRRAALAPAFAAAAARYWLSVYPRVLREVRHWRERAGAIPDPGLRRLALETLREERGNLEGAAAFAVLAPCAERARVVRALTAFQAIYDYADTLAEQPSSDPAANGRQLHLALLDALNPFERRPGQPVHADPIVDRPTHPDHAAGAARAARPLRAEPIAGIDRARGADCYYAYSPWRGDGGYLSELVAACADALGALPGYAAVAASAHEAAARMVNFQSLTHGDVGRRDSKQALVEWCATHTPTPTPTSADGALEWWEIAAGAASSLLVFALIARAAAPNPGAAQVASLERAYFPWVGALHVLLDSLVDRAGDARAGRHSLVDHYPSRAEQAERLGAVAEGAVRAVGMLPNGACHEQILAAMTSFYLAQPAAFSPADARTRTRVLAVLGERATLAMGLFRLREALWGRRLPRRRGSL